jgi:chromosome partitioning protein
MGKTVAFANQKGGVGKTTTAVNLGAYLAEAGKKVLLVDFDPQGNLTSSTGLSGERGGIYEALIGTMNILDIIQKTQLNNLFLAASNIHLTGANVELVDQNDREFFLKKVLADVKENFDYLFVDCPPNG